MKHLRYGKAGLYSVARDDENKPWKQVPLEEKNMGKYIVAVDGSGILRAHAVLWVAGGTTEEERIEFRGRGTKKYEVPHDFTILLSLGLRVEPDESFKLILGGGFLFADHTQRILEASGASMDFGFLPSEMVEQALEIVGYTLKVEPVKFARAGKTNRLTAPVWFEANTVPYIKDDW